MNLDKKTFFGTPTLTSVLEERQAVYGRRKENLAHAVASLSDDQVLVIAQGVLALPPAFYSPQNWMKRGNRVQLPRYKLVDLENRVGPTRTRHATFREKVLDDIVGGYQWNTTDNKRRKKVLLVDCLEAARLFYFAQKSGKATCIKIKGEKGFGSRAESPKWGRTFEEEVPSRSSKDPYVFYVVSVPTANNEHQFGQWRNITTKGHIGGKKVGKRHTGCERNFMLDSLLADQSLLTFFARMRLLHTWPLVSMNMENKEELFSSLLLYLLKEQ